MIIASESLLVARLVFGLVATKKCHVCEVPVKIENLEKHVRNLHPRAGINPRDLLTEHERLTINEASVTRTSARPTVTKRGVFIIGIAAILIIVVLAVIVVNPFRTGLRPGQTAPDFSVAATDGTTVSLQGLRGKPALLEFMDIDCPHCVNEAPVLVSLYSTYGSNVSLVSLDVNFIGPEDTIPRITSFQTSENTPWTYALVDSGVTAIYQVTAMPTIYILNANGVVLQVFTGETPLATLNTALSQALQG